MTPKQKHSHVVVTITYGESVLMRHLSFFQHVLKESRGKNRYYLVEQMGNYKNVDGMTD